MRKYIAIALIAAFLVLSIGIIPSAEEVKPTNNVFKTVDVDSVKEGSYDAYILKNGALNKATEVAKVEVNKVVDKEPINFTVNIEADGLYDFGMLYKALGEENSAIEISLKIDNELYFEEAEKLDFPRIWKDAESNRIDGLGNEFAPEVFPYEDYRFAKAYDITKQDYEAYLFNLTKGVHTIEIIPVSGSFDLKSVEFGFAEDVESYKTPTGIIEKYDGAPIILEGEKPYLKDSYWITSKTDNSTTKITPYDSTKTMVNYIGGGNWKTTGETIVWQTPNLKAGYYQLGLSFRQSAVIGGKTYRSLKIDGKTPFKEAEVIGFSYDDNWQQKFFSDKKDKPYLIYLSEGKHEISLTAVPGEISAVRDLLNEAVTLLGSLYIDITMVTGETVDIYRDYELFAQIPDMEEKLEKILKILKAADKNLTEITGQSSGAQSSVIKNMILVVEQMLANRYTAHRYKTEYYNRYTATASVLYEMKNMPLDIDKLSLVAPDSEKPFENKGAFTQILFSVQRFFVSFINDYNNISSIDGKIEPVTIWVNWGRDQAQVLNSLVQNSFSHETKIPVNIQLVNASIVQATLSGKGPDCILMHSRSEPVNLAMRGVLYNLENFDDVDETLKRFQKGAETPYRYKDGLYALPDTQVFYLMYYRTDVLKQLNLQVPETWEDFQEVAKLLARRNLQVWLPNNTATSMDQVNIGIGSINIFPSLLLQNGLKIYSEDGKKTNLTSPKIVVRFEEWTNFYRKLKLPKTMDFYNRFRTGTCPIGISNYTMYTTLKAAAPEIDGLWSVAQIPGTVREDGTISHASSGGGTSCAILKMAKNPKNAWEFLKWWTSAETQLAYSNEIEAILGPTGRVSVSNVEAFKKMEWDAELFEQIYNAWEQVEEIPEYPGSYYVSRSLYQSFWNVVNNNQNPKDMLLKYGKQADREIERKWAQYENR